MSGQGEDKLGISKHAPMKFTRRLWRRCLQKKYILGDAMTEDTPTIAMGLRV